MLYGIVLLQRFLKKATFSLKGYIVVILFGIMPQYTIIKSVISLVHVSFLSL